MSVYKIEMPPTAQTAAKDLVQVVAPSTAILVLLRAVITNTDNDTSEQAIGRIQRASAAGTGTTTVVPVPLDGGGAFPGTFAYNLSAASTPGNILVREGFATVNGFLWVPTPDDRIIVPPSGILVLRLDSTIASTTLQAALFVAVIG